MKDKPLNFEKLIGSIQQAHAELAAQASRAVNVSLTIRNWLIRTYIVEYEQDGSDICGKLLIVLTHITL